MDWLTFVSKLIDSLAWPAVVVLVLFLFKEPIAQRIKTLRRMNVKSGEFEFDGELLEKTKKQVEQTKVEEAKVDEPTRQQVERQTLEEIRLQTIRGVLQGIAHKAPRAAIEQSWVEVEKQAGLLYAKWSGENGIREDAVHRLLEMNWPQGADLQLRTFIANLQYLRNQAEHTNPSSLQANEYAQLGLTVARDISKLVVGK